MASWPTCDQCGRQQPGPDPKPIPWICDRCRSGQMTDGRDPYKSRREP